MGNILILFILVGLFILYRYLTEEDRKKKKALKIVLIVDIVIVAILISVIAYYVFWLASLMPV